MGINKLWEEIGKGETMHLAELAEKHFKATGRPFRIAVDEPHWRFRNLDSAGQNAIRSGSGKQSNPVVKNILYRVLRYLYSGIQLVFIFDGADKPDKRGCGPLKSDNQNIASWKKTLVIEQISLFKQALKNIGVPYHVAPGEAEAECAALQQAGIVDAVFSEDSDTLMFGATTQLLFKYDLINNTRGPTSNSTKSLTHIKVVRTGDIVARFPQLDQNGLALFALLVGGDYDKGGIEHCGSKKALKIINSKLSASLVECFDNDELLKWRTQLKARLRDLSFNTIIPDSFPNRETVRGYLKPKISSPLPSVNWALPVDNQALRTFIYQTFGFSVHESLRWIFRVQLINRLLSRSRVEDLQLKYEKRTNQQEWRPVETSRVSVDIGAIVSESLLRSWPVKKTKAQAQIQPYVHQGRVQYDVPDYILQHASPACIPQSITVPRPTKLKGSQLTSAQKGRADKGADKVRRSADLAQKEDLSSQDVSNGRFKSSIRTSGEGDGPSKQDRNRLGKFIEPKSVNVLSLQANDSNLSKSRSTSPNKKGPVDGVSPSPKACTPPKLPSYGVKTKSDGQRTNREESTILSHGHKPVFKTPPMIAPAPVPLPAKLAGKAEPYPLDDILKLAGLRIEDSENKSGRLPAAPSRDARPIFKMPPVPMQVAAPSIAHPIKKTRRAQHSDIVDLKLDD